MKVDSYKAYNPDALMRFKLSKRLAHSYTKINNILRWAEELKPDKIMELISTFQRKLSEAIDENVVEIDWDQISKVIEEMDYLSNNPELTIILTRYIIHHLEISNDLRDLEREIEVTSFNHARENERLQYYIAKACPEILGEEDGTKFWKDIVALRLRDEKQEYEARMKENPERMERSVLEISKGAIKWWKETGVGDFTRVIFDDHKILYRFDKCITPEVLKELNDPKWAYLSSCYIGDAPGFNFGERYLRRTQTLHTSPFCDELYWNPSVHENPEQPSLEFTTGVERNIDLLE